MAIATTYLTLSDAGGVVCVSGRAEEKIITAKADGTALAGYVVTVLGDGAWDPANTGEIAGVDVDTQAADWFVGILLPKYNVDVDTAVTAGELVEIVVPKARRLYVVAITNPSGTYYAGTPVDFHATDIGRMAIQDSGLADQDYYAILTQNILTTSVFAEVRWS